jgi:hypothetical protein
MAAPVVTQVPYKVPALVLYLLVALISSEAVVRIRIRKFLGLLDPGSLVRVSIRILLSSGKNILKTLIPTVLLLPFDFLSLKNDKNVRYLQKV